MTDRYAPWKLDGTVLAYPVTDCHDYDIDLDAIRTPAQALHWVLHISVKNWGSDALPGFVAALRDRPGLWSAAVRG